MTARFEWTDASVREALGLGEAAAAGELIFTGVSTDTRTLSGGELFVALKGDRFDGHAYLGEASVRGARAAIVSDPSLGQDTLPLYAVPDTLVALGELARFRRRKLPARTVGVTGSSGKTTVKNLLRGALATAHRVHATPGNLNNRVGLPLSLLAAPEDAEFLVVEMGTNEPGEIGTLAAIAEPDAAVVTTVGEAHLEGLGSLQGVTEEKLDLVRATRSGGPVVVGDEPESLAHRARELRPELRVAGLSSRADRAYRGELLEMDRLGRHRFRMGGVEGRSGYPGRHGVQNALLALAMADLLGVAPEVAIPGIEAVEPEGMRGEVQELAGLTLVLDCYNANPQSVRAAVELLAELPSAGARVAILGSMLELGPEGHALHEEVLRDALAGPVDLVLALGLFARAAGELEAEGTTASRPTLLHAATPQEGYSLLRGHLQGDETILLKGSRGVALETLVPLLEADFTGDDVPGSTGASADADPSHSGFEEGEA